jgi:hypothetical protein
MALSQTLREHKVAVGVGVLVVLLVVSVPVIGAISLGVLGGAGGDAATDAQYRGEGVSSDATLAESGGQPSGGDGATTKATPADDTGTGDPGQQVEQLSTGERAVVREGTVALRVDDYDTARTALTERASALGGYVADAEQRRHRTDNRTWQTGEVVLRVPAEDFDRLLAFTKRQGTVERETTNARDVTDQLADLDARIETLEAQRDRLRTLYSRANTTDDLLAIENRLTEVQSEIERLEAQRRSLQDRVALSTLTVQLREPEPESDPLGGTQYHETGLVPAFLDSLNTVVVLFRAGAVTVAYALPYLLAIGGIAAVGGATRRGYRVIRRRSDRPER